MDVRNTTNARAEHLLLSHERLKTFYHLELMPCIREDSHQVGSILIYSFAVGIYRTHHHSSGISIIVSLYPFKCSEK